MITINGIAYDVRIGDRFAAKSNGRWITITGIDRGDVFYTNDDAPGTGAMMMVEKLFDHFRLLNR